MVYALHKFKHYLLGNKFVFYVDHMALLYLIRKPQVCKKIARSLLLFIECDFSVVYKLGWFQSFVDALSRLLDVTKTMKAPNSNHICLFVFTTTYLTLKIRFFTTNFFIMQFAKKQKKNWLSKPCLSHCLKANCINKARSNVQKMFASRPDPMVLQEIHHCVG